MNSDALRCLQRLEAVYRPIQWSDESGFNPDMRYREHAPPVRLSPLLACFWSLDLSDAPDSPAVPYNIIADAAVDLIFCRKGSGGTWLSVSSARAATIYLPSGSSWFGLRFRPLAATALFSLDLSEISGETVAAKDLPGLQGTLELAEQAAACDDTTALQLVFSYAEGWAAEACGRFDARLAESLFALLQPPCSRQVQGTGAAVSSRHLRRLFHEHVGFGPKAFERVARFQQALQGYLPGQASSPWLLAYTDQAHWIRECQTLGGVRPGQLKQPAKRLR